MPLHGPTTSRGQEALLTQHRPGQHSLQRSDSGNAMDRGAWGVAPTTGASSSISCSHQFQDGSGCVAIASRSIEVSSSSCSGTDAATVSAAGGAREVAGSRRSARYNICSWCSQDGPSGGTCWSWFSNFGLRGRSWFSRTTEDTAHPSMPRTHGNQTLLQDGTPLGVDSGSSLLTVCTGTRQAGDGAGRPPALAASAAPVPLREDVADGVAGVEGDVETGHGGLAVSGDAQQPVEFYDGEGEEEEVEDQEFEEEEFGMDGGLPAGAAGDEPTFWYDHGPPRRDRHAGQHLSQSQLIRNHESRWLPIAISCPCRRRSRGFARLENQRTQQNQSLKRKWDADTASAARGDGSVVELGIATLAGNSIGTVAASPGMTGAELRTRVATLANIPEREVELVLAGSTDTVSDQEVIYRTMLEADTLRTAPQPHLHMLRVQRKYAISGASDGSVRLWDAGRMEKLLSMQGHTQRVQCVSADFTARRAVSGSSDGTLRLWDLDTAAEIEALVDYTGDFHCASTDWVMRRTLGGLSNGTLAMWDLNTGGCVKALHGGHHGPVQCVDVAWGERKALSGSTDGGVMLWDLDACTGVPMQGHMVWISDVKVDPDARYAVSGSIDGMLRVWDLRSQSCVRTMQGKWSDVKCIAVHWDTGRVISGAGGGALHLWDIGSARLAHTLRSTGQKRDMNCISADWSTGRALSGSAAGELVMWDLDQLECLDVWQAHEAQVKCVSMVEGGC